jgi:hypothetical protein
VIVILQNSNLVFWRGKLVESILQRILDPCVSGVWNVYVDAIDGPRIDLDSIPGIFMLFSFKHCNVIDELPVIPSENIITVHALIISGHTYSNIFSSTED